MARTTAAEWAKRVERWQRSGLGAKEFAERERLDAGQLSWWKWRLKTRAAAPPSALLPVRVVARRDPAPAAEPAVSPIEIALPSGARLRVVQGVDEETLARVVRAVEASCS
jgi:transposase